MRGLEYLHPKAREKAEALQALCKKRGLALLITETFRSKAEQDELYAQGRTAPGKIVTNVRYPNSAHCWGVAFDFCRNVKGREFDDSDGFFKKVADLAKTLGGITWGGDWKSIVDKPHLELTEFLPNSSTSTLKSRYRTPENFKNTWNNTKASTSAPATAAPKKTVIPATIRKGASGSNVKTLQRNLGGLTIDGIFGAKTETAVKAYQKKNRLVADGIVGPKTWAKLLG